MTLPLKRLGITGAVALLALALTLPAVFAGDEKPAEGATTETAAPATPSPIHSMLAWVGSQVTGGKAPMCPSTKEGEAAWRGWFGGGKDVPLAGLRDQLAKDGWDADHLVAFFQEMAKGHGEGCHEECEGCPKAEGKSCEGCPSRKGEASGTTNVPAAAPADAPKTAEGCKDCPSKGGCKDCPSKGECRDCPSKGDCCGNCPKDGDCSKCPCKKGKAGATKGCGGESCPKGEGATQP